jgi:hypothetical protein
MLEFPFKFESCRNKKGQMKIQQMIFMIIAVIILFAMVGLFFLSTAFSSLRKSATTLAQEESMLLVSRLANSPEFSCGNAFGNSKTNCVDFDKVAGLKNHIGEYSDFWGVAKIEIRKIYPSGEKLCTEANYPNCEIFKILDKNVNTLPYSHNFISLCRKELNDKITYDKCELALLMIASEDRTNGN